MIDGYVEEVHLKSGRIIKIRYRHYRIEENVIVYSDNEHRSILIVPADSLEYSYTHNNGKSMKLIEDFGVFEDIAPRPVESGPIEPGNKSDRLEKVE
jgi:hypothetical protein